MAKVSDHEMLYVTVEKFNIKIIAIIIKITITCNKPSIILHFFKAKAK